MKQILSVLLLVVVTPVAWCQNERIRVGEIEFFGVNGYDIGKLRTSLPLAAGQEISESEFTRLRTAIGETVRQATGRPPTDVAFVCCNAQGAASLYIGLARPTAVADFHYKPAPEGSSRLPEHAVRLYEEAMDLNVDAVQKSAVEDRSKGYALSSYPPLRAKQLAFREFAVEHMKLLRSVALQSATAKQRAIAVHILGYGRPSMSQINALVSGARDPDEEVRNNAIRALGVLAQSGAAIAKNIPVDLFIGMLNSRTWTDRNKSAFLMAVLSARRDPQLLRELRVRALPSLIEMARWRNPGHAGDARMILGRVAGIPEAELVKLVAAGEVEQIVSAAQTAP